ncbi:MAG: NADH-quinone oxidoreductase subunit L [Candidatus Palauibacterales bacterium]|nr:NADH-quinone oxidoreductase subunit L [Candidatus Palauibacterales bacterium]
MVGGFGLNTVSGLAGQVAEGGGFNPFLPAWIILFPFIGFVVNAAIAFLAPNQRRRVSLVGPGVLGLALALAVINFVLLLGAGESEPVVRSYWTWIEVGHLRIDAALQLDQLSIFMALVVTAVSFVIHVYSVGYMQKDPGYARYFAYLNLFVFFMLVLVLAANFPLVFVGWEGVGLCSYLLIGFWYSDPKKSAAGLKAFVVNRIGDFGFLMGMFAIFAYVGSLDFIAVFEIAPRALQYGGAAVTMITLFLFLGCVGKSAQIPLFVWLPDAMEGPTPVSALIHAATMVTAGVYLIARAGVLFALAPLTMNVVAITGAATAFIAATIAVQQVDIKRVIAYSTISQLGYMFLAVGLGAFTAGIFHLATHAVFKALLFLASGAVIHALHDALHNAREDASEAASQDMRNMGGLRTYLPTTYRTAWVAALALAGVFPLAGFFSKDEILWAAAAHGQTVLWVIGVVTAVLTAGYITRWIVMVFHGESRVSSKARKHLQPAARVMGIPLIVLGVGSLLAGWMNVSGALPLLPEFTWLHDFLHPSFAGAESVLAAHVGEPSHAAPLGGGEGTWAVISTVLAAVAIVAVFRILSERKYARAKDAVAPTGVMGFLYHKWYVDEVYDALIIRPFQALARFCWRVIDRALIDGVMVNGTAAVTRVMGRIGSFVIQTGYVGSYVLVFLLGVLIVLGAVAF